MKTRRVPALALSVAMITAATVSAGPANAALGSTDAQRHCVGDASTGKVTCFGSEASAQALAQAAGVTAVTLYDGKNYSGASLRVTVAKACTTAYSPVEYQLRDLFPDWNDRASSVRTANRCDVKFYRDIDFRGPVSVWIDASANLSAVGSGWSNRASSLVIS